jgi:hypothetical protein
MKVTKAKALSILLYRFGYKGSADEKPCHIAQPHTCCDRKSRRCAASRVAPPSDELSSAGVCGARAARIVI